MTEVLELSMHTRALAADAAAPLVHATYKTPQFKRLSDIHGPAIVYLTFSGCGQNTIHDFSHIEAMARKATVPVYAVTVSPEFNTLVDDIGYVGTDAQGKPAIKRSPGIHIIPHDRAEVIAYANHIGLPINPSNPEAHSNRLVFIDAAGNPMTVRIGTQPIKGIPSTQPVEVIMNAAPWAFRAAPARGAQIGG